ncbi:hypothetical protein GCM10022197_27700 [Microlunatus spumicola]|uniref:Sec-independent protein translocase protein TatA n=1 Tax=Microlunatus spumicola TaxID=81499 RepID=A0ABP6XN46_9ACTN
MDTLFGWPQVPTVTPLEMLGLLGGIPIVVIALIFAIAKIDAGIKASKRGPGPQPGDPVWMGGRSRSIMGGDADLLPEQLSVEESRRHQLAGAPATPTAEADAGGASARW